MITELSSHTIGREARIELFEHEKACVAKRKRKYEFSSLGFFVSFWAYAKKKKHHFGISPTKLIC
ncbi:MAG: hypothetical protein ACJAT4_000279 [Granulosicoccus sp.]|jgi:hypothetical protein